MNIEHNLEVAKPSFIYIVTNIKTELAQWIQYNGVETNGSQIYFKFKSSQISLTFKVYAGVNINDTYYHLRGHSNDIYNYFRELKHQHIY